MNAGQPLSTHEPAGEENPSQVRSLKDLIERVSGRGQPWAHMEGDSGLAEMLPYPFLALVGQQEMKLALLIALVNPFAGGVLLIGPRGTGKTTAVRSLVDLLPKVPRSLCYYGCMPEDLESGGVEAVCPDCAKKYGQGEPLSVVDLVRLIELPLNSRLDDVVGSLDDRAALHEKLRLRRGILSHADRNLLYVDEANLLSNDIIDSILDAAALGSYTVRRGPVSATYRSRFVLVGAMNPEEGHLRPQIMDRFGLRVIVRGLAASPEDRLEVYRRVQAYRENPRRLIGQFAADTVLVREEVQSARELLTKVVLPDPIAASGLAVIAELGIDSLRAEMTLFEAARAHAAMDGRLEVLDSDLLAVAPMALRLRRSHYMQEYLASLGAEEDELGAALKKEFPQAAVESA